jgi:hypothetical protein
MADISKRRFFKDLLREGGKTWSAFQEGREEAQEKADQEAFSIHTNPAMLSPWPKKSS